MDYRNEHCPECGACAYELPDESGRTWCASCGAPAPEPDLDDDGDEPEEDREAGRGYLLPSHRVVGSLVTDHTTRRRRGGDSW